MPLSLAQVCESGLPALFLDYGEALLYPGGAIFDVDASRAPLRAGSRPIPLPAAILAMGVGIDYGRRHAGDCACRFCSGTAHNEAKRSPWPDMTPGSLEGRGAEAPASDDLIRTMRAREAFLENILDGLESCVAVDEHWALRVHERGRRQTRGCSA